jgi:hypothetical protein
MNVVMNVVLMTGLQVSAAELPEVPILAKPFAMQQLLAVVDRYGFRQQS